MALEKLIKGISHIPILMTVSYLTLLFQRRKKYSMIYHNYGKKYDKSK